jgi:DNA repair protein RecO (recombination protein O)
MSERVSLQPAYVLHQRAYRETSRLLEVLTRDYGRIGIVARGARRPGSRIRPLLQPFVPLLLSWSSAGELATLTGAEPAGRALHLQGDALVCGFYLNELLLRLLARHDPAPELFSAYHDALVGLQTHGCDPTILRRFEKRLRDVLGYGLLLHEDALGEALSAERRYQYAPERGAIPIGPDRDMPQGGISILGRCLQALAADMPLDETCQKQARRLLASILAPHLGPRPLKSRDLLLHTRRRRTTE